jgi:GNAT superfamily N-acetyltransferase
MTTLALGNVAAGTRIITGTGRLRQPDATSGRLGHSSRRYSLQVEVRSLGYRTDLMARLLEGSLVEDRGDYLVVRSPHNPTYWWGNFLLLAAPPQPGDAGICVEIFAAEFPDAAHVAIGIDVVEVSGVNVGELTAEGLRLQQSAVLTAQELHEPPHPNRAAAIRELSGDQDWRQAADLRAAVNAGEPGSEPAFLQARIAAERGLTEAGHGFWFGAFLDRTLVAQLGLVTDGSGIARYQNVETHPAARRQGLAGTLVWHAGQQALDSLGASTLVMIADPRDVAIRVYRSVGFTDAETQLAFERQPRQDAE